MRYSNYEVHQPLAISSLVEECISNADSSYFILESGEYIKNCQFCLTDDIIEECFHDITLINNRCILEGAKMDWIMKNFMKTPGNYKGLKEDLNQIIAANNLDDTQLKTNKKGILQACKRVLLIINDILVPGGAAATGLGLQALLPKLGKIAGTATQAAGTATKVGLISKGTGATIAGVAGALSPVAIVGAIVTFILGFIINRIIRLLVDKSDFDNLRNDCYAIIDQLEANAAKTNDPSLKKKYLDAAAQVKNSIKKYDQTDKLKKSKLAPAADPKKPVQQPVKQ